MARIGDHAGGLGKSVEGRDQAAGVMVDHLDAVAPGMRHKHAPRHGIEGTVIEGALDRVRKLDEADLPERHGRPG